MNERAAQTTKAILVLGLNDQADLEHLLPVDRKESPGRYRPGLKDPFVST